MTYDSLLKGRTGKQLLRTIAGGVKVPVEDDTYVIEPETGKDIVSTLDVFIQDVTENALMKMLVKNEAEYGCAIVMEVKTGKIKAIANLGRKSDGNYWEDFNHAITRSEPGSTFKLATMMSLLEDKKVKLTDVVNIEGGTWHINRLTVYDAEQRGDFEVTVKQAFEKSSNVGMAKLAWANYSNNPNQFIRHLSKMHLDSVTGIDLAGESKPVIYKPGQSSWVPTTLPWMAFGYNLLISPLQTATLYNAVANKGKMMRPYLVSAVKDEGVLMKQFDPKVIDERICSEGTLQLLQECLEGVCIEGTAKSLFKNSPYKVAGKTGTALVANGKLAYSEQIYQSAFAGYFPAENPQYTCVVVIKNKPHALIHHGADVAGPVFKEIADRLYSTYITQGNSLQVTVKKSDSSLFSYTGSKKDISTVSAKLNLRYADSTTANDQWINLNSTHAITVLNKKNITQAAMPELKGMALKDVVYVCENLGLKVMAKGRGKVALQSIQPGQAFVKGQMVNIELN